ncbi:MAG: proton-conducting transporter membrane subunit [Hyphomonadaceae bacterium]
MSAAAVYLLAALGAPLLQACAAFAAPRPPGLRDTLQILLALAQFIAACLLFSVVREGALARVVLARPLPNVDLAFAVEPLGVLFVVLISGLGLAHAFHSAAYLRAVNEPAPARLQAFMALAVFAVTALAFSANLFTFFVAYQALTLATFPLVAHAGDEDAARAARVHLATLLTASIGLLLPAIVWTYALTGQLEFRAGGVFTQPVAPVTLNALLVLFVLGVAAIGLPPLHRWLPGSNAAPYPAATTIQGVALVNGGGLGVLKIATYVFGPRLAEAALAAQALLVLAGVTMCAAALIALSKQDIRERMAYSMMAQSAAVAIGALVALPTGTFAAALQIVAQACAAATLLMAAATAHAATGRTRAADFAGLGRLMPWTFASFALAAASLIGMPPFSGAWARLWLITAAADAGYYWVGGLAVLGAVLTFAHWGPLAAGALVARAPQEAFKRPDGASVLMVAPVVIGAAATLSLLFWADPLANFLSAIWRGGG